MSASVSIPSTSLRRDLDSEPLLDSRYRKDKDPSISNKTALLKKRYSLSNIKCFGVELTPDTIAVAMVYFVQGVLGLARIAVNFYLKDDLQIDPAGTAIIGGVSSLPWLVKPLYGFISDSFPLFGYRRRSYLVLSGLLGAFSWSLMATFVDSKYGVAFCILLGSLSVAFSDVLPAGLPAVAGHWKKKSNMVDLQDQRQQVETIWTKIKNGLWILWLWRRPVVNHKACQALFNLCAGALLLLGALFVFGLTTLLPLITSAVAILVKEQRVVASATGHDILSDSSGFLESSRNSITQLKDAVKRPNVFLPTMFIFLWQATPHSDSAMFYFTTNKLGFTPEFLGRVKLVTSVASLLGVGLYNGCLKSVRLRKIFLFTTVIGSTLGMTQVLLVSGLNRQFGISDEWFAVGDSLILTVLGQVSFMPVLVLAAKICPEGMEATLFATLMSISNAGHILGGLVGAGLTQLFGVTKDRFDNLTYLIILCNLSSLLPLPLLSLLPEDIADADSNDNSDIEMKSN